MQVISKKPEHQHPPSPFTFLPKIIFVSEKLYSKYLTDPYNVSQKCKDTLYGA